MIQFSLKIVQTLQNNSQIDRGKSRYELIDHLNLPASTHSYQLEWVSIKLERAIIREKKSMVQRELSQGENEHDSIELRITTAE